MALPISEFLDTELTRWITRGNDLRKEVIFQKEMIEPAALAANGNRLAMRERLRRDARRLEESAQETQARWDERLLRVEQWKTSVNDLQREQRDLRGILDAIVWIHKASDHQERFTRRLNHRAGQLQTEQWVLHDKLTSWTEILQEREKLLLELKEREARKGEPLFVSRARRQPELDFLNEQRAVNEILGKEMQQLRSSMNRLMARLQKAIHEVKTRTSAHQILFEARKQDLESALRASENMFHPLREQVLSDALLYESGRSALNRIQELVRGLRIIEEFTQAPKTGWKRFF